MINISELNGAGEIPALAIKTQLQPLAFIDNGGTLMAVIAYGQDRLQVPAALVSEDNAESGRSYFAAIQKAIELSVVSSDVGARRAAAIALNHFRDADDRMEGLIIAGAFLCSNSQRARIFKYARAMFKTIKDFADYHNVTEAYATELLKECSSFAT
jgi:hypothetical protein